MTAPLRIAAVTEGGSEGPLLDLLRSPDGGNAVSVYAGEGKPDLARLLLDPDARFAESDVVVLLDDMSPAALVGVAGKEKLGKTLVLLAHEERYFPRGRPPDAKAKAIRAVVRRAADAVVAVTQRARDVAAVEGIPGGKIAVCSPGVDTVRFAPEAAPRRAAGAARGEGAPGRTVLFVGRLDWDDGVFDLLHAAKLLELEGGAEGLSVSYVLFGRGGEGPRVREVIDRLGLAARVRLVEDRPGFGDPGTYRGADVLVVPAVAPRPWTDGLGASLLEAMACGAAIVAAHSGSVPEIVGDAAILVPPADPGELARGMGKALRDGVLRAGLGERARRRAVERHDRRREARRLGEFLRGLSRR